MAYGTLTTVTYYLSLFNFSDKGGAQNYSDDDDDVEDDAGQKLEH